MGLEILDVALGLILVYLVLSLVCSGAVEAIAQRKWIRYRARTLEKGLTRLLGEHSKTLLEHPQVRSLSGDRSSSKRGVFRWQSIPSYIPTEVFVAACLDLVESYEPDRPERQGIQFTVLERIRLLEEDASAIKPQTSREVEFARSMREFWNRSEGRRADMEKLVGEWFENAMERVSGNYRRWAQMVSFCVAAIVVPAVNADTIRITSILYQNPDVRAQVAAQAEALATSERAGQLTETQAGDLKAAAQDLRNLEPILGWSGVEPLASADGSKQELFLAWATRCLGWLITILAASMGAPFWFKLLNDLLRARTKMADAQAEKTPESPAEAPDATTPSTHPVQVVAAPGHLEFKSTFEPGTIAHCHGNGYWLGKMAEISYQDKHGFASALAACKPEKLDYVSKKGTQVQIAVWSDYVVVAFRGTETKLDDITTDAKFSLEAWDGEGKVHRGFLAALEDVWPALLERFAALEVGPRKGVWFTGHSLGGALAVLAASRCLQQGLAPVFGLYTIGQPRVGDQKFAEDLHDKLAGRYFRYVNHRDAVPRIPPRVLKYHHTGTVMYFDSKGGLQSDASFWSRLLDVAFSDDEVELKLALKEAAGDHSASEYVELLRAQVKVMP